MENNLKDILKEGLDLTYQSITELAFIYVTLIIGFKLLIMVNDLFKEKA